MVQKYQVEIEKLEESEAKHKAEARELRVQCEELKRSKTEEEKKRDQVL